jgi:transcriptional regulator with XRE-family HTH domain
MRERGLTDRALGESAEVSFTTIQNLRRGFGGQAGIGTLWNVARALGVRPSWLAYGDEPQTELENIFDEAEELFGRMTPADRKTLLKKLSSDG